ncbi:MAG: nucleotidyl transferase AbiEii/AbiGii toxin family protein [Gammaproteobacteria bacterium]|nr:nucleotidyl transferase AbiEii/AbiGii toxin family protein [Gammaproteobacteria bacterium]
MIDRQEVMELAREFGLAPNIIEKDYALGWMLAGISAHPELGQSWVFKGGTCLKKCYFETYRFSEDLDFTLTDPAHLDEQFLIDSFTRLAEWVYDNTGIEIPQDTIRFDVHDNPRGNLSVEGRVGFRGPLQRQGDAPRIKLDLTNDELLVLDPVMREVHHPYSDKPENGIHILSYCFDEVFAEKIRALSERERPRDLYDVIHLYRHDELRPDRGVVLNTLEQKCTFKGIPVPTMNILETKPERIELEAEWGNMLGHQLPALPSFEQFWQELPAVFDWLHGIAEKVTKPAIRILARGEGEIDDTWKPPSMAASWSSYGSTPLEIIRFAGANRLCINLDYVDQHGRRNTRLIEPYSLRRTKDGNLLLYAVKHNTSEDRSYRVDRIQGAEVTKTSFNPRYLIELTPVGSIHAPPTTRTSSSYAPPRFAKPRITRQRGIKTSQSYGPKYVFRCSVCDKRFTKKSYDATLKPHKNKNGYQCYGSVGIYVETKYR